MNQPVLHTAPTQLNTHQCIKLLALLIMTIDHIGSYLYPDYLWWRAIGRITFPVWFFLVGHATQYKVKYDTILWAVVLAVVNPFLGESLFTLNALVTIILCQLLLGYVEKHGLLAKEPYLLCFACVLFCLPTSILVEYGTQGVLYALMGYAVRSGQMTWRTGKLLSVVALLLFIAVQFAVFEFTLPQQIFVAVGSCVVTWYLAHFTWRPIRTTVPRELARPMVWLSRHSLQYYVVHRVLLEALALVVGVSSIRWQWIEV